jgi:hypothetical protein
MPTSLLQVRMNLKVLHDGSDRQKSGTDKEVKRTGVFGLALFFAHASGEELSGVEEKLKRNGEKRAKTEKKRLKDREARQQRRCADQVADVFVLIEGAKQAHFDGLSLPLLPPAYRAAVDSILASSNVRLSKEGHVPGFPEHRLIETIESSDLDSETKKLLKKAAGRAAKRCSGTEQKASPRNRTTSSTTPRRRIVWVNNALQVQEMKKLGEQLRAIRNRLRDANGAQPSVGGCPARLVEACLELLGKIGEKYPN